MTPSPVWPFNRGFGAGLAMERLVPSIVLGTPEFCTFETMFRFDPVSDSQRVRG
jgi:hypothetical protein